jgi:hypothetical protein
VLALDTPISIAADDAHQCGFWDPPAKRVADIRR